MKQLEDEGTDFRLTTSVTPHSPRCSMTSTSMEKYLKYLDKLIELCGKETQRLKGDPNFEPLTHYYKDRFTGSATFSVDS